MKGLSCEAQLKVIKVQINLQSASEHNMPIKPISGILLHNLNSNWMTAVIGQSCHVTGWTTLGLIRGRRRDLDLLLCQIILFEWQIKGLQTALDVINTSSDLSIKQLLNVEFPWYWLSWWHRKALTQWPPFLNVIVLIRSKAYACWKWSSFRRHLKYSSQFHAIQFFW